MSHLKFFFTAEQENISYVDLPLQECADPPHKEHDDLPHQECADSPHQEIMKYNTDPPQMSEKEDCCLVREGNKCYL